MKDKTTMDVPRPLAERIRKYMHRIEKDTRAEAVEHALDIAEKEGD